MRKILHIVAAAMFCALAQGQVPVQPIVQPHMTFVDAAGLPCAGCSLYSYAAGTTTPLATYVDSTGTSVNPNPIILDASGGPQTPSGSTGGIWLGRNSYKLILKSALGATIWTADNVDAAALLPCAPAHTIQISNTGVNGLTCDSNITIDPINHTLNVGVMSTNHVTIGALGTPTSWFLDTTSPATACASIGCSTAAGTVTSASVVTANGVSATVATPTTTPAFTFTLGAITPSSVALNAGTAMTGNQGTGVKVQHSTGSPVTDNCAKFDATGNTVDSGVACGGGGDSSITTNGYTTLSNGLIIQWGVITIAACGTSHCDSASTSLPLTFPTAAFTCTATPQTDVPTGGWNMIAGMVNAFDAGHITVSVDTSQTAVHFSNDIPVGWQCYGH